MISNEEGKKTGFFKKRWVITTARIMSLIFVVGVTVLVFLNRNNISKLEVFGYPGIFFISVMINVSFFLPIPGVLFTSAMGGVFNPFWVAVAAGTGATVGEITGYLAGFSGQGVVENRKWYDRFTRWMKKNGDITILVLAIIPNPLFDVAGMVAGALKFPLWRFLLLCMLGKIIKMLIFAYFGAYISNLIS